MQMHVKDYLGNDSDLRLLTHRSTRSDPFAFVDSQVEAVSNSMRTRLRAKTGAEMAWGHFQTPRVWAKGVIK
eukprot:s2742_g9.t1